MERIGLQRGLELIHMAGGAEVKENAPRERQLPLRGLVNQSITEYQKMEGKSMGDITISIEEYKKLMELSIRVSIFADFVNHAKYGISREDCGRYLGFETSGE